jgi:integrase/predicted GIY-YIG superfamily endonuclease
MKTPRPNTLWSVADAAGHLAQTRSYFMKFTRRTPGFPAEWPGYGKENPKWLAAEIKAWADQGGHAKRVYTVYRAFDEDGGLLYVGYSADVRRRIDRHRADSRWFEFAAHFTFEDFPTQRMALQAEAKAIRTEMPEYNKSLATPTDLRRADTNQLIYNGSEVPTRGSPTPLVNGAPLVKTWNITEITDVFCDLSPTDLRQDMPTFSKRGKGWRAEICCKGIRKAKTFDSKGAAIAWAARTELDIRAGDRKEIPEKTFGDLMDRYADTVSETKKGAKWEVVRINFVKRDPIAQVRLKDFSQANVAEWRDRRILSVSGSTVVREKNLLSHICTVAVNEWHWLKKNPFLNVRMPKESPPRKRLMTPDERARLSEFANTEIYKKVLRAVDFAAETGMRANEICQLERHNINGSVALVEDNWTPRGGGKSTKGGESREVPLSSRALEILARCSENPLFGLTARCLDVHWRNLLKEAGIIGLRFHDTRHLAATNLSKKLNLLQLCKMFGWKDPRHAMIYYNETAEDVAKLL